MKIQIKLNRRELVIWRGFLTGTWNDSYQNGNVIERLMFCALSNMLHKLEMTAIMMKAEYSIKIEATDGLALMQHFLTSDLREVPLVEMTTINKIIGIIDQKTK